MIDFLIFYEVKNREFESIVLLGNELIRRGYKVEYLSFFQANDPKFIKKYKNKVRVAVMPSLYHDKEIIRFVYTFAGKVKQIVNLRWEQVYTNKDESDPDCYYIPKGAARKAIHCNWGKRPQKMFADAGIDIDNLPITGPMQMDILSPCFEEYFVSKKDLFAKYNIPLDKPCILFISSFSFATQTEREIEQYINDIGKDKREKVRLMIDNMRLSYQQTIEWLKEYVMTNECSIIYRPHPTENDTKLLDELKKNAGIFVIKEGNVKQWIKCCDQVYTWISTSIAEAVFAKKNCAIIRPVPINYDEDVCIYRNADFITEKQTFIKSFQNKRDNTNIDTKVINEYYDQDYHNLSYHRTADILEKALTDSKFFPWNELHKGWKIEAFKLRLHLYLTKPYLTIIRILAFFQKIGFWLPNSIKARIRNYEIAFTKYRNNIISEKELNDLQINLRSMMPEMNPYSSKENKYGQV